MRLAVDLRKLLVQVLAKIVGRSYFYLSRDFFLHFQAGIHSKCIITLITGAVDLVHGYIAIIFSAQANFGGVFGRCQFLWVLGCPRMRRSNPGHNGQDRANRKREAWHAGVVPVWPMRQGSRLTKSCRCHKSRKRFSALFCGTANNVRNFATIDC